MRKLLEDAAREGYTQAFVDTVHSRARTSDPDALNVLAMFHREGLRGRRGEVLFKRSARLELQYALRAAELGDPAGMVNVGDVLTSPGATRGDLARGMRYYRSAFRRGHATAAFNLAVTYQSLGRYRDAVQWFRRAHAAGDPSALLEVAKAELFGVGTRRDAAAAFSKLRRVSRGGALTPRFERAEAMVIMADALRNGWLVRRDYRQAVRWLRKAAGLDSDAAKGILADEGIPQR